MIEPRSSEASKRSVLHHGLVRWGSAAVVGVTVTLVLFLIMTRLVTGSWILEAMIRVFPLVQTPIVDPCDPGEARRTPISIDGVVGYYAGTEFVPLPDAAIVGEHRAAEGQPVPVSPEGIFRFATDFPEERPAECGEPEREDTPSKRLIVRAPGCVGRIVPIVRAWVPHRVLLECDARVRE